MREQSVRAVRVCIVLPLLFAALVCLQLFLRAQGISGERRKLTEVKPFDDVRNADLRGVDLVGKINLI